MFGVGSDASGKHVYAVGSPVTQSKYSGTTLTWSSAGTPTILYSGNGGISWRAPPVDPHAAALPSPLTSRAQQRSAHPSRLGPSSQGAAIRAACDGRRPDSQRLSAFGGCTQGACPLPPVRPLAVRSPFRALPEQGTTAWAVGGNLGSCYYGQSLANGGCNNVAVSTALSGNAATVTRGAYGTILGTTNGGFTWTQMVRRRYTPLSASVPTPHRLRRLTCYIPTPRRPTLGQPRPPTCPCSPASRSTRRAAAARTWAPSGSAATRSCPPTVRARARPVRSRVRVLFAAARATHGPWALHRPVRRQHHHQRLGLHGAGLHGWVRLSRNRPFRTGWHGQEAARCGARRHAVTTAGAPPATLPAG